MCDRSPTCAGLPAAAPTSADRARSVSSSGPARSPAGPAAPARSTAPSGCIPRASGHAATQDDTNGGRQTGRNPHVTKLKELYTERKNYMLPALSFKGCYGNMSLVK